MLTLPAPSPQEFRDDVAAAARSRAEDVTVEQVATDFGISEASLNNWLKQADVEAGKKPGITREEAAEVRERRCRNRLLE